MNDVKVLDKTSSENERKVSITVLTTCMDNPEMVKTLVADALAEYAARRSPADKYVETRYPDGYTGDPARNQEKTRSVQKFLRVAEELRASQGEAELLHLQWVIPGGYVEQGVDKWLEALKIEGAHIIAWSPCSWTDLEVTLGLDPGVDPTGVARALTELRRESTVYAMYRQQLA